jgi:hypothetical protein
MITVRDDLGPGLTAPELAVNARVLTQPGSPEEFQTTA